MIIRRLGFIRRILVAAPRFIKQFGPIDSLERLSEVAVVTSGRLLAQRDVLSLRHQKGEAIDVSIRSVLRTNNADVIASTLVRAHAAGPVQQLLVNDELSDGRLVRILPEYEVEPTEAFLIYPSVRFMRPVVRAFTDFAVPALRAIPGVVGKATLPSGPAETTQTFRNTNSPHNMQH